MNENEEILDGGNLNEVIRIEDTVRRPLKTWSPTIHKLLIHLENNNFDKAPKFYGIDENNREILSFIHGETAVEFPRVRPYMLTDEVIVDIATILRKFHDLSISFERGINDIWMMSYPGDLPVEVICHNDCAPYNVVFSNGKINGIIDFDTACPGPRIWDIAYTLYTFVPLGRYVFEPVGDGMVNYNSNKHADIRKKRISLFFNAYGINKPIDIIKQIVLRLENLCKTLITKANEGDEAFKKMINEGHLLHYQKEIEFIKSYGSEWV